MYRWNWHNFPGRRRFLWPRSRIEVMSWTDCMNRCRRTRLSYGSGRVGNIFLARREDGREFSREDEQTLVIFGSQAALAGSSCYSWRRLHVGRDRRSERPKSRAQPLGCGSASLLSAFFLLWSNTASERETTACR